MTAPQTVVARRDRYWIVPLVRAVIAAVAAAAITFTAHHSPQFGLFVFGAYAAATGLVVGVLSWRTVAGASRSLFLVEGAVGLLAGGFALALNGDGLGFFLYLVTVWAVVTGFVELYIGFRARSRSASARDWMVIGALTALLAVVFLVVPPDADQAYTAPDGAAGSVTAPVILVGVFGAYAAIVAVYLGIGAFSVKWGTSTVATRGSGA